MKITTFNILIILFLGILSTACSTIQPIESKHSYRQTTESPEFPLTQRKIFLEMEEATKTSKKSRLSTPKISSLKTQKKVTLATTEIHNTSSTRFQCANLTKQAALRLLHEGHHYLDPDSDGIPCEWTKHYNDASITERTARCSDISSKTAALLLKSGQHEHLDRDGDGIPCESLQNRRANTALPQTHSNSSLFKGCQWIKGYRKQDGTYVKGHQYCPKTNLNQSSLNQSLLRKAPLNTSPFNSRNAADENCHWVSGYRKNDGIYTKGQHHCQ